MKTLNINGLIIGEGVPKIVVPIVANTKDTIINRACSLAEKKLDLVEWRADFFDEVFNIEMVLNTLKELKSVLKYTPIIFSFRTKKEGGEKEVSMKDYTAINKAVAESGYVDLVDVEIQSGDEVVEENIGNIHNAGVYVIGSNHDFFKTPEKDIIVSRLLKAQNMGTDIPKVAVMPKSVEDVLTLLAASNEMNTKYADRPFMAISMGTMGTISRLSGQVFGSALTFGAVGQASAPGQIPVEELSYVLDIFHKSI